jgi:hypothetical protein
VTKQKSFVVLQPKPFDFWGSEQVLHELASLYFAIPSPKNQGNPFGDMMSSFFGGGAPVPGSTKRVKRVLLAPGSDAPPGLD